MDIPKEKVESELESILSTVASVWVAVVVAFVLRAFMFEAFVIPTGSMAPRLMGEHWTLQCPSCAREYEFGLDRSNMRSVGYGQPVVPPAARCPNCNYRYQSAKRIDGGDRVLVLKYLYNFTEPEPWEVVVFKNPQNNTQNYIKRLIGLPGESIQLMHGDVFVSHDGPDGPWKIRRKPYRVQETMWQVVYNNDYPPSMEWMSNPASQAPEWVPRQEGQWDTQLEHRRVFGYRGGEPASLDFRSSREWFLPRYGYNPTSEPQYDAETDIVNDLKLSAFFMPEDDTATLTLSLAAPAGLFEAEISADGTVGLYCTSEHLTDGQRTRWAERKLADFDAGRGHQVALTNVDYRAGLWVDGKLVLESTDQQYPSDFQWARQLASRYGLGGGGPMPAPRLRITGSGGAFRLRHIRVMRDVYYTNATLNFPAGNRLPTEFDYTLRLVRMGLLDPENNAGWGTAGRPIELRDRENDDLDEFFVLGDNSPHSLDGRGWLRAAPTLYLWEKDGQLQKLWNPGAEPVYRLGTVPRYSMIGRALFVYWPSGYRIPGLPRLPILPNVGKMRFIR
ncbi:MAG: signal peptidase I [Phycisphaerae bacterium]